MARASTPGRRPAADEAPRTWFDEEAPLGPAGMAATRRLIHRARGSWPVWVAAALLLAGVLTVQRARIPPHYEATILLRVTEGRVPVPGAQLGAGALRARLNELVFTRGRLTGLLRSQPRYAKALEADPVGTLDDFRDAFAITITENDFNEERSLDGPPRSASVQIAFASHDPELAYTMAQGLADLVVGATIGKQRQSLETEQQAALAAVNKAEQEVAMAAAIPQGPEETLSHAARSRARGAQQRLASAELALRALGEQQGLRFVVADPGRVPPRVDTASALATSLGATLLAALVAGMLLAGAFDPRVLDEQDVVTLGPPVLGRLPRLLRAPEPHRGGARAS